jgi:hypothetical protein
MPYRYTWQEQFHLDFIPAWNNWVVSDRHHHFTIDLTVQLTGELRILEEY